ncbi:MAG: hypothetical protein L0Y60_06140 [Beijerinckiaceae bacterium]|nr:hypothetical protein [Beijerinckiaceae bacterium]
MNELGWISLWGTLLAALCRAPAAATDLSVIEKWTGEYPSTKIVNDKPLWDQPEIQSAMRAAMGKYFLEFSRKTTHTPDAPVQSDGNGLYGAWSCTNADDCGGNQMIAYFNSPVGTARVCWRNSAGEGGAVQDLWLANGTARLLPLNGCGAGQRDPFAPLRKFGGEFDSERNWLCRADVTGGTDRARSDHLAGEDGRAALRLRLCAQRRETLLAAQFRTRPESSGRLLHADDRRSARS